MQNHKLSQQCAQDIIGNDTRQSPKSEVDREIFSSADSIELAPLDEDVPKGPQKKPAAPKPAKKAPDPSETALPIKGSALDPSATAEGVTAKLFVDATKGKNFRSEGLALPPDDVWQKVKQNWDSYFVE